MIEVINGLGLKKPHITGLSLGGFLTTNLAIYYPDSIDKIVLLAPAATFQKFSKMFFIQAILTAIIPLKSRIKSFLHWMIAEGNEYDNAFNDLGILSFGYGFRKLRVAPVALSDTELKNIENPTLLLVGDQEVIYDGPKVIDRAKALIQNVQAEFVNHCGHHIPTEKPEFVNKRILEFLS
ncbi:MAG: pimeloyl-ACP methyl ester carboxylesterase [Limisphaerales bacterium]|jgi:pimeloyl-ACP methyl ester carboxylesterase